MIVALNFIALPDTQAAGAYRYIARMLKMMRYYAIEDTIFHIYKQKHIPDNFFQIPSNLKVKYIDVPTIGRGIKRVIFEQTFFYKYILPCDIMYSYCTSMPLMVHAYKVFTLHDVYSFSNSKRHGLIQRIYLRLTTRMYIKTVDEIITVSEYSKQEIKKHLQVPHNKLSITHNFLLPEETQHSQTKWTYKGKPYFLFIGSILPHKNIIGMVDGFIKFNKNNKYELKIVGKLAGEQEIILEHIKLSSDIQLLGYQSDEEISHLYQNCIGVVLLSFCEGFGIPPLEGFSYGKPALVANTSSLPEVVGKAGILVDPYDINAIANGYQEFIDKQHILQQHIPTQLAKFNPYDSCEQFMHVLKIKYKRYES